MQFIYFIAGQQIAGLIKDAGLADILDDPMRTTAPQIFNGPENQAGFLFSFCAAKELKYKPSTPVVSSSRSETVDMGCPGGQIWQKSNCGKYWIGFYKDSPPSEKELARDVQITGHKVVAPPAVYLRGEEKQAAGVDQRNYEFIIPLARIFPAGTRLPQSLVLGANGEVMTETLPQFALFSARCEKLWNDFAVQIKLDEGTPAMTEAESFLLAADAIRINYRINIDGINALKLFTTANLAEVLLAVIDAPTVMAKMAEWVNINSKPEKKNINPGHSNSGSQEN